ncbi:unnamed protein product [Musa hybrid cultivar]
MGCGAVIPANRYCVTEVFLDEMKEFLALAVETLDLMLKSFISVLEKSADKLLDSASASETLRGNRKILFGFYDDFLWLENDLEKSGVHISTEKLENGSSENVISTVVSESWSTQVYTIYGIFDDLLLVSECLYKRSCFSWVLNLFRIKGKPGIALSMPLEAVPLKFSLQEEFKLNPFKSLDPAHSRSKLLESSPTRNFP